MTINQDLNKAGRAGGKGVKNEQNPNHRQRFDNEIAKYEAEQVRLAEESENEIAEESGITAGGESTDGQ